MVIKGGARGGAAGLADHLKRLDTNEHMEVRELRGVAADDLDGALREMEAVASGARSARHFYHASINTRADEAMTPEQWQQSIDRLEQEMSLTGQPRVVVAHVKEGRAHVHVVWSRIDLDTMRAISDSHNFRRHEIVARELEQRFGHERVQGVHIGREGDRPERTPSHAEMQQAERTGIDPKEARAQLTAIWNHTDSGKAFAAAIEQEGWALARGDRRDFVVLDYAGEPHSLARRIEGAKAKDIRARMADLDAGSLPTVDQAKALQRGRLQAQADARGAHADSMPQPKPMPAPAPQQQDKPDVQQPGQQIMSEENISGDVARALADLNKTLQDREEREQQQQEQARQQAEARKPKNAQEEAEQRLAVMARENADHQVRQIEEIREQKDRIQRFEAEQQRQAEEARQEEKRKAEAIARGEQAEGEIRDAGDRYRIALGQHYDMQNPYGSLSRAAMAEYGAFIQDRERLSAQIAQEQDSEARKALELRRDIETNDYMAITSQRIAGQNEVITGRRDSEEATLFRERAENYNQQSQELRQQYRDLVAERARREAEDQHQRQQRESEDPARKSDPSRPNAEANPSDELTDRDLSSIKGEITDAKAERIARIRAEGRAFESSEKERQNSQSHSNSRGSRSR